MAKRRDDDDKDQEYDPKGEHGGDTGPTRRGAQGTDSKHGKRSGSDSDENR